MITKYIINKLEEITNDTNLINLKELSKLAKYLYKNRESKLADIITNHLKQPVINVEAINTILKEAIVIGIIKGTYQNE